MFLCFRNLNIIWKKPDKRHTFSLGVDVFLSGSYKLPTSEVTLASKTSFSCLPVSLTQETEEKGISISASGKKLTLVLGLDAALYNNQHFI